MIRWAKKMMGLTNEVPCLHRQHKSSKHHSGSGALWMGETCPSCDRETRGFVCQKWYDKCKNNEMEVVCGRCSYSAFARSFNPTILMRYDDRQQ